MTSFIGDDHYNIVVSKQETHEDDHLCPLSEAALLLNSKWDLVVIHNLLEGPQRFSQLKEKISQGLENTITSSSLTRILRKLETEELLERDISVEKGESVEIKYKLTKKGAALETTIEELKRWGSEYLI